MYEPLLDFQTRAAKVRTSLTGRSLAVYDRTIRSIDIKLISAVQDQFASQLADFHPAGEFKYADVPYWIAHKTSLAVALNLDRRPPLSMLDIGTGAGHFPAIGLALNHSVIGIDVDIPIYISLCEALNIERRSVRVERQQPLPDFGRKFEIVTAIWISFDSIGIDETGGRLYWDVEDWRFFLNDLCEKHLSFPGTIHLELNPQQLENGIQNFDQKLISWAADRGAIVTTNGTITFHLRDNQQIFAP